MKLRELLGRLTEGQVRFVVIGGVALIARGVERATADLDIAYARDRANLSRLADVLIGLHPKLRGVPDGLPFVLDEATLRNGLNFTLDTDLGPLDMLGVTFSRGGQSAEYLVPAGDGRARGSLPATTSNPAMMTTLT